MSFLLDLAPINYLSNFDICSNADKIISTKSLMGLRQYRERIVWKRPPTCDTTIASKPSHSAFLRTSYIYLKMFMSDAGLPNSLMVLDEVVHYVRNICGFVKCRETGTPQWPLLTSCVPAGPCFVP